MLRGDRPGVSDTRVLVGGKRVQPQPQTNSPPVMRRDCAGCAVAGKSSQMPGSFPDERVERRKFCGRP